MTEMSKTVIRYQENLSARLRMFCFPFAGGAASAFKHFKAALPNWIEICIIQYPGRETRWAEPPLQSAAELARDVHDGISPFLEQKPFVFFGHSLGALISYEVARLLNGNGKPEPLKLFLSSRRAPGYPPFPPIMSGLTDGEFLKELQVFNGTPKAVLKHHELMELLLPMLRADFAVDENYVHQDGPVLQQDISIYGAELDNQVPQEQLRAWAEYTKGASSFRLFPGDHFYLRDPDSPLFAALAQELPAPVS